MHEKINVDFIRPEYIDAFHHALNNNKNILVSGRVGVGKSSLCRHVLGTTSCRILDSDGFDTVSELRVAFDRFVCGTIAQGHRQHRDTDTTGSDSGGRLRKVVLYDNFDSFAHMNKEALTLLKRMIRDSRVAVVAACVSPTTFKSINRTCQKIHVKPLLQSEATKLCMQLEDGAARNIVEGAVRTSQGDIRVLRYLLSPGNIDHGKRDGFEDVAASMKGLLSRRSVDDILAYACDNMAAVSKVVYDSAEAISSGCISSLSNTLSAISMADVAHTSMINTCDWSLLQTRCLFQVAIPLCRSNKDIKLKYDGSLWNNISMLYIKKAATANGNKDTVAKAGSGKYFYEDTETSMVKLILAEKNNTNN